MTAGPHHLRPGPPEPMEGSPAGFGGASTEFWPAGLRRLGGHVRVVPAGGRSGVLHHHAFEEEVFYVLDGSLTVRELAEGEETERRYTLYAGDLVVYPPGTGLAHAFVNKSDAPATFVALSDEHPGEVAVYPDSGKVLLRPMRAVGVLDGPDDAVAQAVAARHRRPVVTLADVDRPAHVVPAGTPPERDLGGPFGRPLSRTGGATAVFVNRDRLPPGAATGPAHWHSADEELVLVLAGRPTLRELVGRPGRPEASGRPGFGVPDFGGAAERLTTLQPGDVVRFGPDLPLAHHLRNDGEGDALLLVVGTDDPQDLTVFPEQGRLFSRALGRGGAFVPKAYWDGEAEPL